MTTARQRWQAAYDAAPKRQADFETLSGVAVEPVYGPGEERPGLWPYTRGPYASMYRSKLWTMRMFAGFGTAPDTNRRFHELLAAGGDGLSTAFDLPTLMGRDSDDPLASGEVGKCGVAVDTLADVDDLYAGIDLGRVTTSMTINAPAPVLLAMYVAAAEATGVPRAELGGTLQNDILKEYQAQKEFVFPPRPSMRLVSDTIGFCAADMPRWHPVSISGYHIREAGSTAAQELAFTLANGFAYVEQAVAAGLAVDDFAPRLSFFFNAHLDFFEEICKYRAARRIWARWMRDRYHASSERSCQLRFHTQTAGVSLTAQQPEVNIMRTSIEALAGVLGGTQSLHTNSMDETMALPTEKAARLALRTQQVLAHEVNVTNVADPLGGSWYVEALTDELEGQAEQVFARARQGRRGVDARRGAAPDRGGLVPARDRRRRLHARAQAQRGPARRGGGRRTSSRAATSRPPSCCASGRRSRRASANGSRRASPTETTPPPTTRWPASAPTRPTRPSTCSRRCSTRCGSRRRWGRSWGRSPTCSVATPSRRSSEPIPMDPVLFEHARDAVGFMPDEEGLALHDTGLDATAAGPLLEIGTYCGKSAIYLGAAARARRSVLFTVDHHRGSEENQAGWEWHDERLVDPDSGQLDTLPWFRRTIAAAGLEDAVVAVVGDSPTVARYWSTPLGLVFIDGGHAVRRGARRLPGLGAPRRAGRPARVPRRVRGPRRGRAGPVRGLAPGGRGRLHAGIDHRVPAGPAPLTEEEEGGGTGEPAGGRSRRLRTTTPMVLLRP